MHRRLDLLQGGVLGARRPLTEFPAAAAAAAAPPAPAAEAAAAADPAVSSTSSARQDHFFRTMLKVSVMRTKMSQFGGHSGMHRRPHNTQQIRLFLQGKQHSVSHCHCKQGIQIFQMKGQFAPVAAAAAAAPEAAAAAAADPPTAGMHRVRYCYSLASMPILQHAACHNIDL